MPLGALIGPNGQTSETLSPREHRTLQTCLEMSRSDEHELCAIADAIDLCSESSNRSLRTFLSFLISNVGPHGDAIQGVLCDRFKGPVFWLHGGDYFGAMAGFLKMLQRPGWFTEFLCRQASAACDHGEPTPMEVMRSLTVFVEEFEKELGSARRMYEKHPGLIAKPALEAPSESAASNA